MIKRYSFIFCVKICNQFDFSNTAAINCNNNLFNFKRFIFFVTVALISFNVFGQVPGQIFDFSTGVGSSAVLNPNNDSYISVNGAAFNNSSVDEINQFEQSGWVTLFHLMTEPNGDLQTGSNCGPTEIVDNPSTGQHAAYFRIHDPNSNMGDGDEKLVIRMRIANEPGNAAYGYSLLLDTDLKIGSSDPNSVSGNPGFEIELLYGSGNSGGVSVLNVDGESAPNRFTTLASYPTFERHQRSYALNSNCTGRNNAPVFMDFYVDFADMGITVNTSLRMAFASSSSSSSALGGSASDVGGADDGQFPNDDAIFEAVVLAGPTTSFNNLQSSTLLTTESPVSLTACAGQSLEIATTTSHYAMDFDGSNDVISFTGSAHNTAFSNNTQTVELWFKTTDTTGPMLGYSGTNYSSPQSSFAPILGLVNGKLRGEFWTGSSTNAITSFTNYNDGNFHHVALTSNGTSFSMYVDAVLLYSYSGTVDNSWVNFMTVGASFSSVSNPNRGYPSGWNFFDGEIAEVRVWNTARTAAQISANYDKTIYTLEDGLELNLTFPEGTGTSTVNNVNGAAGTFFSTPAFVSLTAPITNISVGPFTYLWSNAATTLSTTVTPTVNTDYYVTITDASSVSRIDTITVVANSPAFAFAQDTIKSCGASTATIDAGAGWASYAWSNAATTQTTSVSSSGTYSVTVTDANGCTATDDVVVSVINGQIIQNDTTICSGQTLKLSTTDSFTNDNSMTFDGNGDFVLVPYDNSFNVNTLTIESWVYTGNLNRDQGIFEKGNINTQYVLFYNIGSVLKFRTVHPSGTNTMTVSSTGIGLTPNNWHHIAATYDGANKKIYVDGVLKSISACTGAINTSTVGSIIGAIGGGTGHGNYYWDGKLDEVRVWNVARSASEIASTYNKSVSVASNGLIGYWNFEEGSGSSTINLVDNQSASLNGDAVFNNTPSPASVASNLTYNWSTAATTSTITVSPTATTTYYVTTSDGIASCIDLVTVTVNSPSFAFAQDTIKSCGSSTATIDAGAGWASYAWSNAATTQTTSVSASGTYSVTVTDNNGCTATDDVVVSAIIDQALTAASSQFCAGNGTTITTNSSEINVNYSLYEATNNTLVDGPLAGTGASLSFQTGNLNASTDFYLKSSLGDITPGIGEAISFDGTNQYATVPININTSANPILTITAWVKRTAAATGPHHIVSNDNGSWDRAIVIQNDGKYHIFAGRDINTNIPSTLNQWEHIAVYYSNSEIKFYLNGQLVFSTTGQGGIAGHNAARIGGRPERSSMFTGLIDEVTFWNRALSDNEVNGYQNMCDLSAVSGLLGHYRMEEGSGSTLLDETANVNNGTLFNSPLRVSGLGCSDGSCSLQSASNTSIVINPSPTVSLTSIDITCNGLSDGSANATVTGGTTPYTYVWNNAATTASISGLSAGTYTVTIGDANSCTSTSSVTITEPALLVASTVVNANVSCNGGSDGSATASAIGGTTPYSYAWSNAATTANITGMAAGTYTVTISDANSCTSVSSVNITAPASISFALAQDTIKSCGSSTATLDAGAGWASYAWSNAATTQTTSVSASGTYSVTVTDNNGCTATDDVLVSVINVGISNTDTTICSSNSSLPIAVNIVNENNFAMSFDGSNDYINITDPSLTAISNEVSLETWVYARGTSDSEIMCGNTASRATKDVRYGLRHRNGKLLLHIANGTNYYVVTSVDSLPLNQWVHVAGTFKQGVGGAVYINGELANSTISTTVANHNLSISNYSGVNFNIGRFPHEGIQYFDGMIDEMRIWSTARSADEIACNMTKKVESEIGLIANFSFSEGNILTTKNSATNTTVNLTGPVFINTTPSVNNYTYLWSNGSTCSQIQPTVSNTTTYTVTISNGISSCVDSVTVTVNNPTFTFAQDTLSACGVDSLLVDAGAGWASYAWSNAATTQTTSVSSSGTYSVTVTDANGCTPTDDVVVGIIADVSSQADTVSICLGDSTELRSVDNGVNGLSKEKPFYSLSHLHHLSSGVYWYRAASDTFQIQVDGTTDGGGWVTVLNYMHVANTNPALKLFTAGLPLEGSDVLGTNESSSSTTWGHASNTLFNSLNPDEVRFFGQTSAHSRIIHFKTSHTNTLNYFKTGLGSMSGIENSFTALAGHSSFLPANAVDFYTNVGDYAMTDFPFWKGGIYHWGVNGLGRWEVDDFPNNSAYSTKHRIYARGGASSPFNPDKGYTYAWSNGDTTETINVSPTVTTKYYVTVSDGIASCVDSVTVIVNNPTFAFAQDTIKSCGANTVTVDAGAGWASYAWSNAATTQTTTVSSSGTYSVTVTDANGCAASDEVVVSYYTVTSIASVNANVLCNGGTDGGATASATGGVSPYTFVWSNAATTPSITGVSAGTYTVTVTDDNLCTSTSSVTITEPAILVASSVANTNVSCNGLSDGSATASATGGTAPYTYAWNNAATTAAITGVSAGTYTVTVTDANSCTSTSNVTITEPAILVASSVANTNVSCNGLSDGSATASATGGTAPYTYAWSNAATTASITGVTAGTYTVTISDANACIKISSVTITEPNLLVVSSSVDSTISCNGLSDGGATASATGGVSPYTFAWSNSATTASITGVSAGTYTVTVTDANTCTSTSNVTITEPAVLTASTAANTNVSCNGLSDGSATASATGGVSPYTFAWSNSATTAAINSLFAGTYTVTVTDGNNCTAVSTVAVLNNDTVAPAILTNSLTVYVDVNGLATITANDLDNGTADNCQIATLAIDSSNFDCTEVGANSVVFTATDASNNVSTANVIVTVVDSIKPTIATQPLTVYLDASGQVSITPADLDNGTTDNCQLASIAIDSSNFDCSEVGANTVVFTATDVNSNVSTANVTVTVLDTIKPTVTTQPLTVYLDANGSASITTSDLDNGTTDNCQIATLAIDSSNFDCTEVGANTVVFTATDVNSNVSTANVTVTVLDTLNPIVATQPLTVYLDASGSATITANDLDNGTADNCQIATLAIDSSNFDCTEVGANSVVFTATDASNNVSTANVIVTVVDSIKPIIATQPLTVYLDANGSAIITANDLDNGTADNCQLANIAIDSSNFDCSEVGANTVVFTATDVNNNVSTANVIVTVVDSIKPIVATQPLTVYLDANGLATITANDLDNGTADNCQVSTISIDSTTFDYTELGPNNVWFKAIDVNSNVDSGIVIVTVLDTTQPILATQPRTIYLDANGQASITAADLDNGTTDNGTLFTIAIDSSNFDCSEVGANTVVFTATDASNNASTANVTVTVIDSLKPIISTQPLTVYLGINGLATITANDLDNGTTDNCQIATIAIDSTTFDYTELGPNNVWFKAIDVNSNVDSGIVIVTVLDTTQPILATQPRTIYLDANGQASITAADLDNGTTDNGTLFTIAIDSSNFDCSEVGANTVVFTATDASNNASTANVTVTVIDSLKPVISTQPLTVYLGTNGLATITANDLDNGTADNCQVASISIDSTTFDVTELGPNNVRFTAVDVNGNRDSTIEVVTVLDTIAPMVSGCPTNITISTAINSCDAVVTWVAPTANDNGQLDSLISSHVNGGTFPLGTTTITYVAYDQSMNTDTCSFTITVIDSVAPIIANAPSNISVSNDAGQCGAVVAWTLPTATDNCQLDSLIATNVSGTVFTIGTTTVTYIAYDAAMNTDTISFTITVNDTELPTISCIADTTICGGVFTYAVPTATDNCGIASVVRTSGLASGTVFPVGSTIVTHVVTDIHGNIDSCSFTVTRDALPTVAVAGSDYNVCVDTVMLSGNTAVIGTGVWGTTTTGVLITDAANPTTTAVLQRGSNELIWTISNGVCASSSDTITIIYDSEPTIADAGADQIICEERGTVMEANTPLIGLGTWSIISGTAIPDDENDPRAVVTGLSDGENTLVWTINNGTCNVSTDTVNVKGADNPALTIVGDTTIYEEDGAQLYVISDIPATRYQWDPVFSLDNGAIRIPYATPTENTVYTVRVTTADECFTEGSMEVTVIRGLVIPGAFTPNDDGMNDTWDIKNLEQFDSYSIIVYDGFGSEVFKSTNYSPWNGTYEGRDLTVGSYYYLIDYQLKGDKEIKAGVISILR